MKFLLFIVSNMKILAIAFGEFLACRRRAAVDTAAALLLFCLRFLLEDSARRAAVGKAIEAIILEVALNMG